MTGGKRRYVDGVPEHVETNLRTLCLQLPDAYEERAWAGTRWMVRKRTFAHVLGVSLESAEPLIVLSFRSAGEELEMLRQAGHPFFMLGWGRDGMGMVIDDKTDWGEVAELVTESFCVVAPKKLAAIARGE
jgi:YjbR